MRLISTKFKAVCWPNKSLLFVIFLSWVLHCFNGLLSHQKIMRCNLSLHGQCNVLEHVDNLIIHAYRAYIRSLIAKSSQQDMILNGSRGQKKKPKSQPYSEVLKYLMYLGPRAKIHSFALCLAFFIQNAQFVNAHLPRGLAKDKTILVNRWNKTQFCTLRRVLVFTQ